jgi:hypothetical protein
MKYDKIQNRSQKNSHSSVPLKEKERRSDIKESEKVGIKEKIGRERMDVEKGMGDGKGNGRWRGGC